MLDLKNVTLVSVDGVNPELTVRALKYSSRDINFGAVKILTFKRPDNLTDAIQYVPIERLSAEGYNRFIATALHRYIDTDFCLIVQPDGFLLNAELWSDEFLEYDYIGAPWPTDLGDAVLTIKYKRQPQGKPYVGNGGFSFRSKRILEEASKYSWVPGNPEDNFFCFDLRESLEKAGMKYAPWEIAEKFAMECPLVPGADRHLLPIDFSKYFGFHGLYPYLWKRLDGI